MAVTPFNPLDKQYVSLDDVVRQVLIQEGKDTQHDYARYFEIGILGIQELTFDILQEVYSAVIPIDCETRSITLPHDYVQYLRIGLEKDGHINWFGKDKRLCLSNYHEVDQQDQGNLTVPTTGGNMPPEEDEYKTSRFPLGRRFGQGGGYNQNGYFRENKQAGTIYFSSDIGCFQDATPASTTLGVFVGNTKSFWSMFGNSPDYELLNNTAFALNLPSLAEGSSQTYTGGLVPPSTNTGTGMVANNGVLDLTMGFPGDLRLVDYTLDPHIYVDAVDTSGALVYYATGDDDQGGAQPQLIPRPNGGVDYSGYYDITFDFVDVNGAQQHIVLQNYLLSIGGGASNTGYIHLGSQISANNTQTHGLSVAKLYDDCTSDYQNNIDYPNSLFGLAGNIEGIETIHVGAYNDNQVDFFSQGLYQDFIMDFEEDNNATMTITYNNPADVSDPLNGLYMTWSQAQACNTQAVITEATEGGGTSVYMEYLSNRSYNHYSLTTDYSASTDDTPLPFVPMVHLFAEEALIAYIRWRSIQNTSSNDVRRSGADKQFAEREYYNQKRLARARMQNFNVDQAYRAGRRHFKQAPKM